MNLLSIELSLVVDVILLSFIVKLNGEPRFCAGFEGDNRSCLSMLNTGTRVLNCETFFNVKAFSILGTKGVDPSLFNVIGL